MKKRVFLFLALAMALGCGAFAQNNWISSELKGPGAGLRYEYVIIPSFTVGGYASYAYITIPLSDYQLNSVEFGAAARWYPFARRFFMEVSIGYNMFEYKEEYDWYSWWEEGSGFCIAPGFGWTIDVGKMGGFFLSPGVKFPITLGEQFNATVAPYLGLGIAF